MIASTDLTDICLQLHHDSGGKKVMLCAADGEVLAHAGELGTLDDAVGDALAQLVADALEGATAGRLPATKDLVATLPAALPRGLSACATAIGTRAMLVVLFDAATTIDRVRVKVRRARELLLKNLPTEEAPKPEPS